MNTIIVTGASRGIGLATVKKFLKEGWQVIGTYLNTEIPIKDEHLIAIPYDQSNPESIIHTTQHIKQITTHIDILVNSAGIILDAHDSQPDLIKIRKTFEVDLFGIIDFTERLLPLMSKGGHIINIDSQYGSFSFPIDDESSTGYRLAKTALNMYTRILAFRLQPQGIIVSSLDPGWVSTAMGNDVATETEKPDRQPHQPAEDIYKLATHVKESGHFWRFGKIREW